MARTAAPDSATSQFFINHVDNAALDFISPTSWGMWPLSSPRGWMWSMLSPPSRQHDARDAVTIDMEGAVAPASGRTKDATRLTGDIVFRGEERPADEKIGEWTPDELAAFFALCVFVCAHQQRR